MKKNHKIVSFSVVIASIGGQSLARTLDSIASSYQVPDEIIVVLPPSVNYDFGDRVNCDLNILYLNSPEKGQVAQRIYGFTKASSDIVVQSDDDIIFEKKTLPDLVSTLSMLGRKHSVAPMLHDVETLAPLAKYVSDTPDFFCRLVLFIQGVPLFDRALGKIYKTGFAFLPILYENQNSYEVDWLPGGVVASWRDELIIHNFFLFSGKAYCEDLFNSIERTKSGIKQIILRNIVAYTWSGSPLKFHELLADHRIRRNLVRFWRLPHYYMIFFASLVRSLLRQND